MNLKILATKTHHRLSLIDSLAELLVLTHLEIEMAERGERKNLARVSGGGELAFAESSRKEE